MVIDNDGYRKNIGIVIYNKKGEVLWAKRFKHYFWQFPQGGINFLETPEQAMYRELLEEVGLYSQDVKICACTSDWLYYKLPKSFVRLEQNPICVGQKQKWFLLKLISDEFNINLRHCSPPEFDTWRWVSYWYPIRQVASFKRDVYRKMMKEFVNLMYFV